MRNRYSSKKKLGVLVSSLALVAVTAMAGVTGTAAWFTANRVATATASSFTAYAPNSTLKIQATAGQGTRTTDNTDASQATSVSTVTVTDSSNVQNYLRDASFDATTGTLYRANVDDSDSSATSVAVKSYSVVTDYDSGSSVTVGSVTHKVYYAVSWTYKFIYDNPNANGSVLFFDLTSAFVNGNAESTTLSGIEQGFRIAFNFGTNDYLVWANGDVKTYVSATTYNGGNTPGAYGEYVNIGDTGDLIHFVKTDTNYKKQDDGLKLADAQKQKEYLGEFTTSATSFDVKCTAWFEGSDTTNVVTGKASQIEAIKANMKFYVRDLAKASE
jgi:hypothetical protein